MIEAYNASVAALDQTIQSIWGCLQLAGSRFAGQQGTKYLVMASDMLNTNCDPSVDCTPTFFSSKALKDVNVRVIYYYCTNAEDCQETTQAWTQIFNAAGAASVQFTDPATSSQLSNIFSGN